MRREENEGSLTAIPRISPATPTVPKPPIHRLLLAPLLLLPAACDPEIDSALPPQPEILATEPLSRRLEEFVGGHAKLVWTKQLSGDRPDSSAVDDHLELWGLDTRDGRGARRILDDQDNYARPLVSPSGDHIVFTHKGIYKKPGSDLRHFEPSVFRIDWDGEHLEKLATGYAVDVWRDPATSVEWVYVTDLLPTDKGTLYASRLERFKLLDPGDRELVYDGTQLGVENIQLSRDGKRASGLFPWPDAGLMNLEDRTHRRLQRGCWPSMAPDDSHLAWVFDGSHKNLHVFTEDARDTWPVAVDGAPGVDGREVYHPRWSNHVRFFAITGPYIGETLGQSKAATVEIHLGRFSPDIRSVESWLQVTDDELADHFPDLWVKYSETRAAELAKANPVPPSPPKPQPKPKAETIERDWPVTSLPLLFVWEDRSRENLAGAFPGRACGVEAREQARFGPRHEMLADGGRFDADPESSRAVTAHFAGKHPAFTIEVLATPATDRQDGVVAGTEHFQLRQRGSDWVFVSDRPGRQHHWIGTARAGEPAHLVIASDGVEYLVFHNGKAVAQGVKNVSDVEMLAGRRGLTFGGGWDGAIEAVNIAPGRLDESRLEAHWKYLRAKIADRPAIPRVRLRATLLEMTADRPVEALDTYPRALLAYLYRVEEVLEGSYSGDKVLALHWTVMDRMPLQGFPRRPGDTYELLLEPYAAHPQLVGERQWNDILEPLELYYDVATPQP